MAEDNDLSSQDASSDVTSNDVSTTDAITVTRRNTAAQKIARPAKTKAVRPARSPRGPRSKGSATRPVRSLVILTMVGGLIATVALPAYGAFRPTEDAAMTLQQDAVNNAQSLVVASDATGSTLQRESYSATTAEEIEKKKAEEAAAARAKAAAAAAAAASAASSSAPSSPVDVSNLAMVAPGSGEVRWPLSGFTKGRGLWAAGYHQGVDLLAPARTPLYAAAAGVVRVSQESFGGYGVAVTIDHVIDGQKVNTLYGHMTYGTRQVQAGQKVEAGQLIGLVGSTGSSTANHVHFEVHINGGVVDPWAWLQANAG